ncbi:extracellular solute-binding protein [Oceanivirga miroungae]|uniref:Spermidine/putrescine-binding periplasmic protein n=1 Tax=Oceanivirga miroungae TaxID=1130046 RepID=A0A6I8M6N0_9FUSO|nr:extracellular solute-binding protein [Oceanivirga miroungae]VWL85116.1 Spermidine/putrescine-binding periplasmic protein [Oceanivirga miroungae]
MKKIFNFITLILISSILISCGKNEDKNVLNIYTWESFIPEEVIENFEKETNIHVNISFYDTNDIMMTKLLSGVKGEYDIVSPSTDFVELMIEANLLQKLDKKKLNEVFSNLDEELNLYEYAKIYDPNLQYSIPYGFFATGITVNKSRVKEYRKDLSIFLDQRYSGKMTMLDDGRELIGVALQNLGYNSDSSSDKELEEAKNYLISMKKNLAKYDSSIYGKGLATGEFFISHGYPDVFYEIEDNEFENFEYFLPKGAMMYIDSMAILKDGKNKENAYKFLKYLYKPENFKYTFEKFRQIPVVKGVYKLSDVKPILKKEEIIKNAKLPKKLSVDAKYKQDKIFNEIKLSK